MKYLDQQDIQYIDDYLLANGVHWFDLRMELVDHLAHQVEVIFEAGNEDLEKALVIVKKSFGPQGFSYNIKARKKAVQKAFFKSVFVQFKSCFIASKGIGVFCITLLLLKLHTSVSVYLLEVLLITLYIFATLFFITSYKKNKIKGYKFMSLCYLQSATGCVNFLSVIMGQLFIVFSNKSTLYNQVFILLCVLALLFFWCVGRVSNTIFENNKQRYQNFIILKING